MTTQAQDDLSRVINTVQPLPRPRAWPALVVLVGPLGAGKSTIAEALRARTPIVVLRSDEVRDELIDEPVHSFAETQRVARVIRAAAGELLLERVAVMVDDANLTEFERSPLYALAEQHNARLILVEVTAPMNVVLERLRDRHAGPDQDDTGSAADLYHRMAGRQEPIAREHYTVDTSSDVTQFIDALAMDLDEG
jgi:hypothetical protein